MCLPNNIRLDTLVQQGVTVDQKLHEVGAYCANGKLLDSSGKEIHFYHLKGCWGNPPYNYKEILDAQQKEITTLREKYRVIEIDCNPTGILIQ